MANILSQRATAPPLAFEPPPRNPRRLRSRSRNITIFAPVREERPLSTTFHPPAPATSRAGDGASLSRFAPKTLKLATSLALERPALNSISPLSSPENADGDFAPIYDQVSPVEDDNELLSPTYCMTGQATQSARKGDANKPGAFQFPPTDGYSSQASAPRSPQMQFATLKAMESAEKTAVPEANPPSQRDRAAAGPRTRHSSPAGTASARQRGASSGPAHRQRETPSVAPLSIPHKSTRRASPGPTPMTRAASTGRRSPLSPADQPASRQAAVPPKARRPASLAPTPSKPSRSSDAVGAIKAATISRRSSPTPPPSTERRFRADVRTQPARDATASPDADKAIRRKPAPTAKRATSSQPSQSQGLSAPTSSSTRRASTPASAAVKAEAPSRRAAELKATPAAAREEARDEARDEAREEVREEVRDEAQGEIRNQAQGEVRDEAQDEAREEVQGEAQDEVRDEARVGGRDDDDGRGETETEYEDDEEELSRAMESKATFNRPFSTVGPPRPKPRTLAGIRSHHRAKGSLDIGLRPASILFIDKPLPVTGPELESLEDRIAHLHAVLSGLALRRININRGIKQLTDLAPFDGLFREGEILEKRESQKRKLEALKDELAEVQRLQHDLGLKLHRAYKRQERESNFEPTNFWVRRRDVG